MRQYIPNIISGYRVAAAPIVCLLIYEGHWVIALSLCMGGFATDLIDGRVARRLGVAAQDDDFGSKWDVFGDRTLILGAVLGAFLAGGLPPWTLTVLVLWTALLYSTEWLFPSQVDGVNGLLWGAGYAVVGLEALGHLTLVEWLLFVILALWLNLIGAATHLQLVERGFGQLGVRRRGE